MVSHPGPAGSAGAVAAAPAAPAVPGAAGLQERKSIFPVRGNRYVELMAGSSSRESNRAFYSSKSELVLKGKKAQYRTPERNPRFLTTSAPDEAPLGRPTAA